MPPREPHAGPRPGLARELQSRLLEVIRVEMGIAQGVHKVADTEIGRIGCAICYDWLFPEAIRQLAAY